MWAVLLLLQNASFTLVSRARASASLTYHAVGAIFSNGIWFAGQVVVVTKITEAFASNNFWLMVGTGVFYIVFTVIGSLLAHKVLMRMETGKMQVGSREL